MRPLSFLLAGAAMFVAALTVNAATVCQGKILNPVTDVCWSCVFPVKIGGKASLTTSVLPDPDTGAGGPFCTCGKGLNLRAGVTFSFWEPLRTAEIVRHAGCLPSMGGVNMGDMGLRISDHVKVHSHEPDGSMKRHTDFRQVHWYATPWLFILEALLDDGCLDQQTFDLAYMSELDPLWDDTLSSFILNPDAALFANPIAQGADLVEDAVTVVFAPLPHALDEGFAAQVLTGLAFLGQSALHHVLGGDAGVVYAGNPEGIVALHPLHAGHDIRCRVALGMACMQAHAGRIGEHIQNIILGLGEIPHIRMEGIVFLPIFVPLGLNGGKIVIHCFPSPVNSRVLPR